MFIPTMVHQSREMSPRAEELARRIAEAVEAYRSAHPDLTAAELQQALLKAASSGQPGAAGGSGTPAALLSAAGGLVVALVVGMFLFTREQGGEAPWPVVAVLIGVIALAAVLIVLKRLSS